MKYTESNTVINAELMMPRSSYDPETYFEFTIEGKNTYSKDIYYEILINHGDPHGTRKTRLDDKFLRFRLEEIVDDEVTPVIEEGTYEEISNTKIWVNTIKANTKTKTSIKYRLYMWITDEVNISASGDYTNEKWNNDVFASIKVSVNGDFEEKKVTSDIGTEVIKATLGKTNGIIAVSDSNQKVTSESEDIREYRYSGTRVNNYVYFNCEEGELQNADNCEKWRIIGVFEDENGAEHLKIVKNEVLEYSDFPETYTVNGTEYKIKTTTSNNSVYWNNNKIGYNNNWATAGLQYWLNSEHDDTETQGYLSNLKISAKSMIEEKAKYYLGAVTYVYTVENGYIVVDSGIRDTPNEAYKNERTTECTGGKGPSTNSSKSAVEGNNSCRVWANNSAIWEGSIALLYPSDFGYSADSSYWDTILDETFRSSASVKSWLQMGANHKSYEWLLSPASNGTERVFYWVYDGIWNWSYLSAVDVDFEDSKAFSVRPCLYLKSEVKIVKGDGTEKNAYQLEI